MVDLTNFWILFWIAVAVYLTTALSLLKFLAWTRRRLFSSSKPNALPEKGTSSAPASGPAPRPARALWRRLMLTAQTLVLFLAFAGIAVLLYALYVEPYRPVIETVQVASEKLPAGAKPFRVVFLSDTHCDAKPRLEERIPGLIRPLKPDVILFGGDAVNVTAGSVHFRRLIARLGEIAPVYCVEGNWENWWFPGLDLYGGTGARLLNAEAVTLSNGETQIQLAGVGMKGENKIQPLLSSLPKERFTIFMHHYPETGVEALKYGADLALGGDTHGGQVRLPFLGPLVRISRAGNYFEPGMHRLDKGLLYVSRGIGMEGGRVPRARFFCPPEITLIEIGPRKVAP